MGIRSRKFRFYFCSLGQINLLLVQGRASKFSKFQVMQDFYTILPYSRTRKWRLLCIMSQLSLCTKCLSSLRPTYIVALLTGLNWINATTMLPFCNPRKSITIIRITYCFAVVYTFIKSFKTLNDSPWYAQGYVSNFGK
jgi:hypothetical protein